jgi:hypothetical protein
MPYNVAVGFGEPVTDVLVFDEVPGFDHGNLPPLEVQRRVALRRDR